MGPPMSLHCVIDGDFLDMAHQPLGNTDWLERNLAAIWANYRALGYTRLICHQHRRCACPPSYRLLEQWRQRLKWSLVLLTCTEDTTRQRLTQRESSALNRQIELSTQMAVALEATCPSTVHRVPTTRSIQSVAAAVIQLTGLASPASHAHPRKMRDRIGDPSRFF